MSKRKLLLADDSITIQKVVNLTFADEGIEVVTAGDGDAAMKRFVESTPDLVMADVNMPGVDGYKICEMIKQDEETKDIPVILLVGSFEPFDEEEARRVGADDYLTKPFQSIRQLVNKVSALLENANNAGANDNSAAATAATATEENYFGETVPQTIYEPELVEEFSIDNLGDAGMDDEIIQTSQFDDFTESETRYAPYNFDSETENDQGQTRPLTVEDITEIAFDADIDESAGETGGDSEHFDSSSNYSQETGVDDTDNKSEFNEKESRQLEEESAEHLPVLKSESGSFADDSFESILNFDEFNLLELPFPETSGVEADEPTSDSVTPVVGFNEPAEIEAESDSEANESKEEEAAAAPELVFNSEQIVSFPPEIIEAIADKVAERISGKAVEKITAEITPQIVELIKKLAAENYKE